MKKIRHKLLVIFVIICMIFGTVATASAKTEELDERYFQYKKFDSENGLEGTSVNCITSSGDGFLWLGGYSGLQRYDGKEFKTYTIKGKTLPVNDIEEDKDGHFLIATNGEGLYHYNGIRFRRIDLKGVGEGTLKVNSLLRDSADKMWVGTKEGLFVFDSKAKKVKGLEEADVLAITEVDKGKVVIVEKKGPVHLVTDSDVTDISVPEFENGATARCCEKGINGEFFIGTSKEQVLRLNAAGEVLDIYSNGDLKCINSIKQIDKENYWLCTDSGVGLMTNGNIQKTQIPLTDSVEEACADYEGNYWFVSSRQGVVQVFNNMFLDLGTYLDFSDTVNSVVKYHGELYVGCDDGLLCFNDKDPVSNRLTQECAEDRIRHIYKDRDDNLWVSTYYSGLKIMEPGGQVDSVDKTNSDLATNQIRCTFQKANGEILAGTEQGVYVINQERQAKLLVEDADFNNMRILDVREAKNGTIYAATDGNGVYEIKEGKVTKIYTKKEGILTNVVMKVVPSSALNGVWLVSGIGINFLADNGKITEVKDMGMANVLALTLLDDGDALIYAANGLFKINEKDLLKGSHDSIRHYSSQNGLPIDFTANAWCSVTDNMVYMCGTKGIAAFDLKRKLNYKDLKLYVSGIFVDGKEVREKNGEYIVPADGKRVAIDVRCINYIYQDYYASCFLEGVDKSPTVIDDNSKSEISYANLKGGDYVYHFKIISEDNNEVLGDITIPIHKNKKMTERGEVQFLLLIFVLMLLSWTIVYLIRIKEKRIKKMMAVKYKKEQQKLMERMAYRDMVTGVYNRNLFEEDKNDIDMAEVTAVVLFSVNYMPYIEKKIGVMNMGELLRSAVKIAEDYQGTKPKEYRLTEKVFCFVFTEPVDLDDYIATIKTKFSQEGEEKNLKLSLAVGAVYNNNINNETLDTLIRRCEKTRMLDEKKAEAEFVEGQINMLS